MYHLVESWIDNLNLNVIPEDVVAFCFNLYDGCDNLHWSMELIGADSFDAENDDWACGEITDFKSRETVFKWTQGCNWEAALEQMVSALKEYLDKGRYAPILKSKIAVAVGFTDGDLEILYNK